MSKFNNYIVPYEGRSMEYISIMIHILDTLHKPNVFKDCDWGTNWLQSKYITIKPFLLPYT